MLVNGNKIFAGTVKGVYLSENNGKSWSIANSGLPLNYNNEIHLQAIVSCGNILYAGTKTEGIFISADNGLNWKSANNGFSIKIKKYLCYSLWLSPERKSLLEPMMAICIQ